MTRSPIPALCLQVLASDPARQQPYTTTEVQQAVARLGHNVTRDTIAKHLRSLADVPKGETALMDWYGGHVVTIEHAWRLSSEGWLRHHTPCPAGYVARHAWAERMLKTHNQIECPGCGLFMIWEPKGATS